MNLSLTLFYNNENIITNLNIKDNEPLTALSWQNLYINAQKSYIPYYCVAAIFVNNGKTDQCFLYDGVTLFKYLKKNNKDPQTRLNIQKVDYLFFKTFEFKQSDSSFSFPLQPLSFPVLEKKCFMAMILQSPHSQKLMTVFFDSLNSFALENADKEKICQLAKSQFVIGSYLKKENLFLEGLRWIWCAAHHHLPIAQKTILAQSLNHQLNHWKINLEEAQKWMTILMQQHGSLEDIYCSFRPVSPNSTNTIQSVIEDKSNLIHSQ